jgi:hypothetical protein
MHHFVRHPHLLPRGITPPTGHKPPLVERIKNNGMFVLYAVFYGGLLVTTAVDGLWHRVGHARQVRRSSRRDDGSP